MSQAEHVDNGWIISMTIKGASPTSSWLPLPPLSSIVAPSSIFARSLSLANQTCWFARDWVTSAWSTLPPQDIWFPPLIPCGSCYSWVLSTLDGWGHLEAILHCGEASWCCWEPPIVVEIAPTLFVKVRSPPSRAPIVESRHLALCEGVRRIRWP